MSGLRRANADDVQPTLSFTASLRLTKAGTDAIAAGEASLLFYAASTEDTDIHFEKPAGSLGLTRGTEAGPIAIDTHTLGRQRILADPALLEMEWNGSGAVGIVPSALDAKTLLKRRTHQRNHTRREHGQRSRCGRHAVADKQRPSFFRSTE